MMTTLELKNKMTKTIIAFTLSFSTLCFGAQANNNDIIKNISIANWEPVSFESINKLTDKAGFVALRESNIEPNSLEIRIWIGFGITYLKGIIIRKVKNQWSGYYIAPNSNREIYNLNSPYSGWDTFFEKIKKIGVMDLPDSSDLKNKVRIHDGFSYVFEILKENQYRTYMYPNPKYQKWVEAQKVLKIDKIFSQEFKKIQ